MHLYSNREQRWSMVLSKIQTYLVIVPELDPKFVYVEIFCIGKKYLTIPPPVRVENNNIFKGINYTLTNAALRQYCRKYRNIKGMVLYLYQIGFLAPESLQQTHGGQFKGSCLVLAKIYPNNGNILKPCRLSGVSNIEV